MKTWMKMLIAVAVMAMMAACHPDLNEKNNNQGPSGPDNSIFLSLNVALPPAGPAAKADGDVGHEAGTEAESKVSTMLVVLADKDNNNYITHGTMVNPTLSGTAGNQSVTGVASMDRGGLSNYYSANGQGGQLDEGKEKINVFVFCNYTQALLQAVTQSSHADASWIHAAGEVTKDGDESIWRDNYFLMSNESIAERELPKKLTDWNKYGEESTPFSLCGANGGSIDNGTGNSRGPIKVQRAMARIDLKDGSGNDWTFPISTTGSGNGELRVKIERVFLVNQSKQYFFLKHVVKDGITGASEIAKPENSTVCGAENGTDPLAFSYVVDADADEEYKQQSGAEDVIATNATAQNFLYPLFNGSGAIDNDVRKRWDATSTDGFKDSYKTWTYTTENTTPHNSNRAGITTGVVFKGRLVPTEQVNQTLKDAANGDYKIPTGHNKNEYYLTELKVGNETKIYPLLYAFGETNRKIYAGWNDQVKTAVDALAGTSTPTEEEIDAMPDGRIDKAYWAPCYTPEGETAEVSPKAMFDSLLKVQQSSPDDVQAIERAREAFKAAAVKAGFTVYQAGFATEDFNDGETAVAGSNDAGYFCYYFYWIRHNLAESVGDMYPMEYAVVRNNVYKLSIKGINRFGHPRFSAHDVDPVTVNTPCEKSEIYMSVEVQVADWVTRESEITL